MSGEAKFSELSPPVRARFIRMLADKDGVIAAQASLIETLKRENARLEKKVAKEREVSAETAEAYGSLCDYVDLMESPAWEHIPYEKYAPTRQKYLTGRKTMAIKDEYVDLFPPTPPSYNFEDIEEENP